MSQCTILTKNGLGPKCKRLAIKGEDFCAQHLKKSTTSDIKFKRAKTLAEARTLANRIVKLNDDTIDTMYSGGPMPKTLFYPNKNLVVSPLRKKPVMGRTYVWGQGSILKKFSIMYDTAWSTWTVSRNPKDVAELIENAYKSKGMYVTGTGADPVFEVIE